MLNIWTNQTIFGENC